MKVGHCRYILVWRLDFDHSLPPNRATFRPAPQGVIMVPEDLAVGKEEMVLLWLFMKHSARQNFVAVSFACLQTAGIGLEW